jgi:hypothetical protein
MSESEELRPNLLRNILILSAALAALGILGKALISSHDGVEPTPTHTKTMADPLAAQFNSLVEHSDSAACREVLRAVDSTASRQSASREQIQPLVEILKLDPKEAETLAQSTFTLADAEYLADCFLIRDAIQSLALKNDPPLTQAERCFAWDCRQIYLSSKPRAPAPSWWVLQAGSASGIDRANVFLTMLRQLGLDGCLIGPPQLGVQACFIREGQRFAYAPVRAVGVRIGKDIFLFDPWQGEPITVDKKIITLGQLQEDPGKASAWLQAAKVAPEGVKDWQVFVTAPLQALAPRMEWLEKQMPAEMSVRLYCDLNAMIGRFKKEAGVNCLVLNPKDDPYSLVRLFDTFYRETKGPSGIVSYQPEKEQYRYSQFPNELIPELHVGKEPLINGGPWKWVQGTFRDQFSGSFLKPNSGRDNLLRGNFNNALSAFSDLKDRNSNRGAGRPLGQQDLDRWAEMAVKAFSALVDQNDSVKLDDARRKLEEFITSPTTEKVVNFIFQKTSSLLSAEASYQIALVKHERAERASAVWLRQPDNNKRAEAVKLWSSAVAAWRIYLQNYDLDDEIGRYYTDRNDHARRLQKSCEEQLALIQK